MNTVHLLLPGVLLFASLSACDDPQEEVTDAVSEVADTLEPDTTVADTLEPDTTVADTLEPDTTVADTLEPDTGDTSAPDLAEPDTVRAETTGTPGGVYTVGGGAMRLVVPEGALPPDWSPTVLRRDGVEVDLSAIGLRLEVGAIWELDDAPRFDTPVAVELPYPDVADNEVFVALIWEPAISDWVLIPHAIDLVARKVYVLAPHFSTVTTAAIGFQTAEAAQALGPGLGVTSSPQVGGDPAAIPSLMPSGAPAMAMGSLFQATAQAVACSAQNAANAQQQANVMMQAATTQAVSMMLSLDLSASGTAAQQVIAALPAAQTSGYQAQMYLSAPPLTLWADPCASAPCAPGTCQPSGSWATCDCPAGYEVVGLSCGKRNEPPRVALARGTLMFVAPEGSLDLTATVGDPEGRPVTVLWSAPSGTFDAPAATTTTYRAPSTPGSVAGAMRATDQDGATRTVPFVIHVVPGPLHRWTFDALVGEAVPDLAGTADLALFGGATLAAGQLVLDGVDDFARSGPLSAPLGDKTLIVRVALANTTQGGGSALTVESPNADLGDVFDGIVFGERTASQWMAGSDLFYRTPEDNGGAAETSTGLVDIAVVYQGDEILLYRLGTLYAVPPVVGPAARFDARAEVLIGVRHAAMIGQPGSADGIDPYLAGTIDEALVYGRALTADEVAWLHLAW